MFDDFPVDIPIDEKLLSMNLQYTFMEGPTQIASTEKDSFHDAATIVYDELMYTKPEEEGIVEPKALDTTQKWLLGVGIAVGVLILFAMYMAMNRRRNK
jgi:hypothetical protein